MAGAGRINCAVDGACELDAGTPLMGSPFSMITTILKDRSGSDISSTGGDQAFRLRGG